MSAVNCPRCGGSGKTEHTHIVYGVCFLCKGNGVVSEAIIELSEAKKKSKAEKIEKKLVSISLQNEIYWKEKIQESKKRFDLAVEKDTTDLLKLPYFNRCIRYFECLDKPFSKDLFEEILGEFGGFAHWNNYHRLSIVKFFRLNGVFNSKYEHQNDEHDFNEFIQ